MAPLDKPTGDLAMTIAEQARANGGHLVPIPQAIKEFQSAERGTIVNGKWISRRLCLLQGLGLISRRTRINW